MKYKSYKLVLILLLVLSISIGGCNIRPNGDVIEEPPMKEEELIVVQGADARTLDPHRSNDQPSARVMNQIYETLVYQNDNMEIEAGLATSWEAIDETTYEFRIKEGIMFHNGEELTAYDVKFTLLRGMNSSQVSGVLGIIDPEKLLVYDRYTIRIGTKTPFAPMLAHLAHSAASILNEKAVVEAGDSYGRNPIGTGPYKLVNWVSGKMIKLERFDGYNGEDAKIKNLKFLIVPNGDERITLLEAGEIHISYDVPAVDIFNISRNQELSLLRMPNYSITSVGFNVERGAFRDVRVRHAINHAVDMQSIVEAVYNGVGFQATGPLGPNVWAAHQELRPYGYDLDLAKILMEEAGYGNGFKATIWTNENLQRIDIANILHNQLKAINIDLEVKIVDWDTYLNVTESGLHDMFIFGWVTVTGDPDYGLYPLFHSSHVGTGGNSTFYSNEVVDELLDLARSESNVNNRISYYKTIQEIIRDDAPMVFTWVGEEITAIRKTVKGFNQHPSGNHKLSNVYFID